MRYSCLVCLILLCLVLLSIRYSLGHAGDVSGMQFDAFRHMVEAFYQKGIVDNSRFEYQPVDFTPAKTFQEMSF